MCGVWGAMSPFMSKDRLKFLQDCAETGVLRGRHSTGMYCADGDTVYWQKKAVPGAQFIEDGFFIDEAAKCWFAVGHNRWATLGELTDANAHPFHHGDVTLVHNGTLETQMGLSQAFEFGTDSECIAHNINKNGAKKTIEALEGAFVLIWYDAMLGTLNFVRNAERPLYLATTTTNGKETALYWASEKGHLEWLLERNYISNYTVVELPVGEIWSYTEPSASQLSERVVTKVELMPDMIKQYNYATAWNKPPKPTGVGWGKPKSGAKALAINDALDKVGIKPGDWISFIGSHFKEYGNKYTNIAGSQKPLGTWVGFQLEEPFMEVEVHGVSEGFLDHINQFHAKVISYRNKAHLANEEDSLVVEASTLTVEPTSSYSELDF